MGKNAKQRQAEYRAWRKAAGLCAHPGCNRKPRKYSRCPDHRAQASEDAAVVRIDAAQARDNREELERLRRYAEASNRFVAELVAENKELRPQAEAYQRVPKLALPPGREGSERLENGVPRLIGLVA